jgi:hypothetical protein
VSPAGNGAGIGETPINSFACEKNHKFELDGFLEGG